MDKAKATREELQIIEEFMNYHEGYLSEWLTWNDVMPIVQKLEQEAKKHHTSNRPNPDRFEPFIYQLDSQKDDLYLRCNKIITRQSGLSTFHISLSVGCSDIEKTYRRLMYLIDAYNKHYSWEQHQEL